MKNRDGGDTTGRGAGRFLHPGKAATGAGDGGRGEPLGLTARLRGDVGRPGPDRPEIYERSVVAILLELAARGNPRAVQDIWTRLEGRPGDRPEEPPFELDEAIAKKLQAFTLDDDRALQPG
jgi:hypothetical protein